MGNGSVTPAGSPASVVALWDRIVNASPRGKDFLIGASGAFTYGELADDVRRLGTLFDVLGLRLAARVVIASRDDRAVATIFLALLRHGITAVLLNPEARDECRRMWCRGSRATRCQAVRRTEQRQRG